MPDHGDLRRLLRTIAARLPLGLGRFLSEYAQSRAELDRLRREHRNLRSRAQLADRLIAGEPFDNAVAATVRLYLSAGQSLSALSLSQALQATSSTRVAGLVGAGLVAQAQNLPALAWSSFRDTPTPVWRRLAAEGFFRAAFEFDRETAVRELQHIVQHKPEDVSPAGWIGLIKAALGAHEDRLASEVFGVADYLAKADAEAWAESRMELDWLQPWLGHGGRGAAASKRLADEPCVAVFDYKQPDRSATSTNIGDYVQTLASLGHLVRHQNVHFNGPPETIAILDTLRSRVRPERLLGTPSRAVTLVPVHRDASSYSSIPPKTWAITFGWFMHSIFGRYDFPLHPHLRPIFISFHCNRQAILSPLAIEYLRAHGPVGCRDWTTVNLLLSAGVPAFFSGCLTTTLDIVFPDLDAQSRPGADAPVAYVDVKAPDGGESMPHADERVRYETLADNLRRAIEVMEDYRSRYSAVVTSRLHCYLPCRSIGMTVRFAPRNPADIRYDGLVNITDTAFAAMQQDICTKLAAVLGAIFSGESEEAVYELWRNLCDEDVAKARACRESIVRISPPSFDVRATCNRVRARAVTNERSVPAREGRAVDVALALDGNFKQAMNVVVNAMVEGCSRPLHLWVLCRDQTPEDFARFSALFPDVSVTWLQCDDIDYGPIGGMLRHITVATMDRLLLPELLPELDRLVYHDIDALPLGDVAELYDWDLQDHALAARSSIKKDWVSGFGQIVRAAERLKDKPAAGRDLLQRMFARHSYDFLAFNAGILVLSLSRMRADQFVRDFVPFVEQYGMNDQEVLNCYTGANRATLPPQWNMWPAQELINNPRIIHWAGPLKPWSREYVAQREVWADYARRLALRERQV
jgi:lipopolysaccharide biosynthesis glycosyltransferase